MDVYLKYFAEDEKATIYYHFKDNDCIRQIEFHPNRIDRYTEEKPISEFGFLADRLENADSEYLNYVINKEEFEEAWIKGVH
jgi:hypothetical protein